MTDRELEEFIKFGEENIVEAGYMVGGGWAKHAITIAKALRERLSQPVHASDISQERVDETAKREHVYFQFAPVHEPVTRAHHEIKGWPDDTKWRTYPKVQPEQEPMSDNKWKNVVIVFSDYQPPTGNDYDGKKLNRWSQNFDVYLDGIKGQIYTAPPKREWVGLEDENLDDVTDEFYKGAVWAEAKLKEKNI